MSKISLILATVFLALLGFSWAQVTPVELEPERMSYLLLQKPYGDSADGSFGVASTRNAKNYKWAKAKSSPAKAQWQVQAPQAEPYQVIALVKLKPNGKLSIKSSADEIEAQGHAEGGWQRLEVGQLKIAQGQSALELTIEDDQAELKALELLPSSQWPAYQAKIAKFRAEGAKSNFADKVYGVAFTWGNWSTDQEGNKKEWPQQFAELDIEAWADMVSEMGAGYVIFTISWGEFFAAAPLKSVESITPGRSTIQFGEQDYLGEMIAALNQRGIEMILYMHHGQGDEKRLGKEKGTWWKDLNSKLAEGAEAEEDFEGRDIFNANYKAIVSEIGERYGKRLYGWWFDDGCLFYPQDFVSVSEAVRAGNPQRLITYNNSKLAPYTEFQDYAAGELTKKYSQDALGEDGLIVTGRNRGLIPHGWDRLENHWAVYEKAPKIINKGKEGDGLANWVIEAAETGYCITFNVMMYADGQVHPTTLANLKRAKQALQEAGFERDFSPIHQD